MRVFYLEHRKMHYQTDRDTVLILLREQAVYEGYTREQLTLDLQQLVKWKNLTPIQDPRKPRTKAAQRQRILEEEGALQSYGRPAGTVRLDDATQEECGAVRNIFGHPFSPPLRFQAAQFEAALQELRFGKASLKEVLECCFVYGDKRL